MRKIFITSAFLLFFLLILSAPKAFAKCSFEIQPTYTSDDVITITANQLTPGLLYFLWVDGVTTPYPVDSRNVTSASSAFTAGKLAARDNPYGLSLTGKSSQKKLGNEDFCQGETKDGFVQFLVNAPSGQTINPNVKLWILNGDTPPRCVQPKFGEGVYATQQKCEEALALSLAALSTTPIPPLPPCAKWVFALPADHIDAKRLNNTEIPPNDTSYSLDDKIKFGKCAAVDTAIGKIDIDPAGFVKRIFSLVLGLAGGIALILIIISGYKFMASQGNPEAVKAATEQITSAIVGLLFIIFAFVILQIIGVDILRIPGFKP